MKQRTEETNAFDPFAMWRNMRDASLDAWSKAMTTAANTEAYARMTGLWLDTYLNATIPMQRMTQTVMTQMLEQMNMPTRADVTNLAERLTNIEMKLDDLDARLDALERHSARKPD